jgi:hypothetical protein
MACASQLVMPFDGLALSVNAPGIFHIFRVRDEIGGSEGDMPAFCKELSD